MNRIFNFSLTNNIIHINYRYDMGHKLGESFISPDKSYSYINIPKNASSTLKQLLPDWKLVNFQQTQPTLEYLVILRDPTERWISAMAEYLVGKYSTLGPKNSKLSDSDIASMMESSFVQNLLFDFVIFDGHSLPQCWFLQQLDIDKIKFFYFDKSVSKKITSYIGNTYTREHSVNSSLTDTKKHIIVQYLTNLIDANLELQKIIDKHYYADHQLFDRVKFN